MTINLSTLPLPQAIEELDYEAIVARQKQTFQNLWEAVRLANPDAGLPEYDVQMLETDPAMIIIQENSYRELLERARINSAVRSNLLAYSVGGDLVNLAADHGVAKLPGEQDEALRERIVLADQGRSTAGPEEWYKLHVREVDADIRDVAVYRPGTGPELEIAILTTSGGGTPGAPLLAAVLAAVSAGDVRSMNDVVSVISAVKSTVNVSAGVWLLPDTPMAVFDGLEAGLRASAASEGGIGFDLNTSWITARLMPAGVAKVDLTSPATDVVKDKFSAAVLGTITLTYMGRRR